MKKLSLLLVVMLSLMASNMNAQQSGAYFLGKWEMLLQGAPQGDIKMTMTFARKDGKLEASIQAPNSASEFKITQIEEKEKSVTLFFTSPDGYDVDLFIEKVDDDNAKGNVANMFDIKCTRIKSN